MDRTIQFLAGALRASSVLRPIGRPTKEGNTMRKIFTVVAATIVFSGVALADWTGTLLDSACHDRQQPAQQQPNQLSASCAATRQTTSFALSVGSKVYKFDAAGNSKAMAALKNRADRTAPGAQPSDITAKVEGSESGGTIKVEKIDIQ